MSGDAYDLVVIGAGVNGAGIARDAAMRGLRVLVVEKSDISSGTSAWATRLIHGGLRYLEFREVSLVRESLRERERLLRHAPHLVRPIPMLVPVYRGARYGSWMIRTGMVAYDLLSLDKTLPHHRMLSREKTLERAPGLNPEGLTGGAVYYDAQVEFAERLVLENALSARAHGAEVLTHTDAVRLRVRGGEISGVELRDAITGAAREVRGRVVVNVAGPWVDRVLAATGTPHERLIGGTKGSHIVVAPFEGAPETAVYSEARSDKRPFFVVPWNGRYLIGTTDLRFEGNPDDARADESEIDYLLDEANALFPGAALGRGSVLYTYSGVRPLPYQPNVRPRAITRSHVIRDHGPEVSNLLSIVGGKLTTYRSLAEEAVDRALEKLGERAEDRPCGTAAAPLPGADTPDYAAFAAAFEAESGLPDLVARRLLRVYGTRAARVAELARTDPRLGADLGAGVLAAEIVFAFREEMARTLEDAIFRRTMAGWNADLGMSLLGPAARVAAEHLGWSGDEADRQVAATRAYARRFNPPQQLA